MLRYSYYSFVIMGTVQSGEANEKGREGRPCVTYILGTSRQT